MQRIIIDTDAGVDDALAILLALAWPDVQIQAITTVHGNVPVETATRLHDPLAVGVALDRSLVQTQPMNVDIETSGELTCGMVVAERSKRRGVH